MPSTNYAYVNGRFVPEAKACVSIFDRGFLYGDGVFETMRVYGGRFFRPLAHMDRLAHGLRGLGIESVFTAEELRAICRALIERNAVRDGLARVYVTPDSVVVTCRPQPFTPRSLTAIITGFRVDPQLSRYKTANRLPYILAQHEAMRAGADEAALLNHAGHVVEFAASNIFAVKDGEVITPPLADGALPGITRHAVLELAGELRIPAREQSFAPAFLESADEVFATNSRIEITPVTSWGCTHEITKRLQGRFQQLVQEELKV